MSDTANGARAIQTSYPVSYPAGVFLVSSTQHLDRYVSSLRATRKLKAGHNVTVFDAVHFAEAAVSTHCTNSAPTNTCRATELATTRAISSEGVAVVHVYKDEGGEKGKPLQGEKARGLLTSHVRLHETTTDEAAAFKVKAEELSPLASTYEVCSLVTLHGSEGGQRLHDLLRIPRAQRTGTTSAHWPSYMAVHVTGELSDAELLSYLRPCPSAAAAGAFDGALAPEKPPVQPPLPPPPPPVAFLRGVRRFHRVCCPDLKGLPSALAALRQSASLQRCRVRSEYTELNVVKGADEPAKSAAPDAPSILQQVERRDQHGLRTAPDLADTATFPFTFSELFGGIGMFRTALERVGGRATFAVEFAPPAQVVYALNHSCWHDCPTRLQLPNAGGSTSPSSFSSFTPPLPALLVGDITEIPTFFFPHHDVLTGGFPCQSFAKAGAAAGLHADKGWLFYEVVRVLAATRPAAFLLENVEHLTEVEAGRQLEEILCRLRRPISAVSSPPTTPDRSDSKNSSSSDNRTDLQTPDRTGEEEAVEYEVHHVVVDGGALTPQTRRRVYFFGFRTTQRVEKEDETTDFEYPQAGEEAAAVAAAVVTDALHRVQHVAKTAPYTCVSDLLVAPSVKGIPMPRQRTSGCEHQPARLLTDPLQLSPAQWEAVRRSRTFRQNPLWRLCDLGGKARTLLGSYRTSYQLYSEFVPYAPTLTLQSVKDALRTTDDRSEADAPPPLRFFALRECARLQGIDDAFRLPHVEGLPASSSPRDEDAIPPPVLRQVPSGAVYKLVGNAVNPRVVECLGGAIAAYLQSRRKQRHKHPSKLPDASVSKR
ncbi:modification methylase-like protein [Leptomonas pyrrhocoris]|uniref:DNA (cytosine-5-)-methyltransferase n=1 Tax=Leptomonas pyrrhocoris TaxID=157538 RepID=A0A0M9G0B9_LEPPY|nr:modification methylase-like protein [Leptomonas pyrrhocoris]XP_015658017.1 modification methylase-like protein [Leptomonas pyrrhocoris]KPA79577.1 modification methylase-like protein [Leptomonas pyrrhocoris]KPA79578.1 modification methylase-like protein [Leptomonas pyrrhocoris]|eukprot:XP_015658016.1 modification methylase-like protein [Leptomonas pyrrhocoris]